MVAGILLIIGSYSLAAIGVHWAYYFNRSLRSGRKNVVLIVRNNEKNIEWAVRSLLFYSWMRGRDICIYFLDEGSTDDSMKIAERFIKHSVNGVYSYPPDIAPDDFSRMCNNEQITFIRLSQQNDFAISSLL